MSFAGSMVYTSYFSLCFPSSDDEVAVLLMLEGTHRALRAAEALMDPLVETHRHS